MTVPGAYVNVAFYLLVVGAGVSVALQQVLNANLRVELGSAWWAGFVSYFVGTLAMLADRHRVGWAVAIRRQWPRARRGFRGPAGFLARSSLPRRS